MAHHLAQFFGAAALVRGAACVDPARPGKAVHGAPRSAGEAEAYRRGQLACLDDVTLAVDHSKRFTQACAMERQVADAGAHNEYQRGVEQEYADLCAVVCAHGLDMRLVLRRGFNALHPRQNEL